MAVTRNITVDQGSTYIEVWNITQAGTPIDFAGYEIRMMVRRTVDSSAALLSFSSLGSPAEIIISTPTTLGQITLTIPASATTAVSFSGDDYENVYDLEIESPLGVITRITQGTFIIKREITR